MPRSVCQDSRTSASLSIQSLAAFNRHRCLTEAAVVDAVRVQLLHIATEQQFEIPAYCFMPDHVHILATGTSDGSDLRQFLKDWKQQTGHAYKQAAHIKLWQGGIL
jgi:REP element-mobilizing transposase RayT